MKKLLLYISVIVFAICSSAWGGEFDEKGLICKRSQVGVPQVYYFENENVRAASIDEERLEVKYSIFSTYVAKPTKISWTYRIEEENVNVLYSWQLDRKNLKMVLSKHDLIKDKTRKIVFLCSIFNNLEEIEKHFQPEIDKIKEEMKKN